MPVPCHPFTVYTPEVFHVIVSSTGEIFSDCSPPVTELGLKFDDPLFFVRRELATPFDSTFASQILITQKKRKVCNN